jgi:prepilin-type N-terminal cleavage/methylation domain-containing protein
MMGHRRFLFKRHRQSGVTLLELLVALALIALLASFGFNLIAASGRALTRGDLTSQAVDRLLERRELRSVLERAVVLIRSDGSAVGLTGTREGLVFAAVLDDGVFWAGQPVEAHIDQVDLGAGSQARMFISGLAESDRAPVERQHSLSGPGTTLQIDYFGRTSVGASPAWQQDWPANAGLPMLVRVVIGNGTEIDPPLIVRPGRLYAQREMSLSSLVPPTAPSRP